MKYRLGGLFAIGWCALLLAGPAAAQNAQMKALNDQVAALYRQGNYDQAMEIVKMALDIGLNDLGPEHPDVARSLGNQGMLYQALGRNKEAEPLFKRSLAILEKALGPDHFEVADALDNLAGCYKLQGKETEAEILHERALAILKKSPRPKPASPAMVMASGNTSTPAAPAAQNSLPVESCVRGASSGKAPKYNDLITAVMLQDEGAVRDLLNLGKWIDAPGESGFTPVIMAARLDDLKMAQLLLACGADPNYRNQLHLSALDYARQNNSERMASLLRRYGARDK